MKRITLYLRQLQAGIRQVARDEAPGYAAALPERFVRVSTLSILVYTALGLSVVRYYGEADSILMHLLDNDPGRLATWFCYTFYEPVAGPFHRKLYWAGMVTLMYLVIPALIVRFGFRQLLSTYGLATGSALRDYPLYLMMIALMIPVVYLASASHAFQARYPIFQPESQALFPVFIWWQLAYFIHFVAVEFFFRGFLLHGLKHRFGYYAVFVSMVPYCMVHYGKPFGETISAIAAGIVLGTLSLKSRSVLPGIVVHYSVAITMDLFALYREGLL